MLCGSGRQWMIVFIITHPSCSSESGRSVEWNGKSSSSSTYYLVHFVWTMGQNDTAGFKWSRTFKMPIDGLNSVFSTETNKLCRLVISIQLALYLQAKWLMALHKWIYAFQSQNGITFVLFVRRWMCSPSASHQSGHIYCSLKQIVCWRHFWSARRLNTIFYDRLNQT